MNSMTTLMLLTLLSAEPGSMAVTFEGELSQLERGQAAVVVKEFTARTLLEPQPNDQWQATTLVTEGTAPLPWPEQLTQQSTAESVTSPVAIGYRHDERMYVVPALFPLFIAPEPLSEGLHWEADRATFEVVGAQSLGDVECWLVNAVTGPARRHQIWVRKDQPVVEALKQTVFVGQGDRFELFVKRKSTVDLTPDAVISEQRVIQNLRALQTSLKRDSQDRSALLNDDQITIASAQLPAIVEAAEGTALASYVSGVAVELDDLVNRADKVAMLAEKFVGHAAPAFTLARQNGMDINPADLRGKVVVLHFWSYQDEPLEQPYGQIGYLDFLATRYQDRPLAVYGVAVHAQLAAPMTRDPAIRSIRRLTTFMKIGYEVTLDTRSALNQFGNPTRLGAELPLWIVLDGEGNVVHYHSGYYSIDNTSGLKELDEIVAGLLPKK